MAQQHIHSGYGAPPQPPEHPGAHYQDTQRGEHYLATDAGEYGVQWQRVVTLAEGSGPPSFGSGPVMWRDTDTGELYIRFGTTWHRMTLTEV